MCERHPIGELLDDPPSQFGPAFPVALTRSLEEFASLVERGELAVEQLSLDLIVPVSGGGRKASRAPGDCDRRGVPHLCLLEQCQEEMANDGRIGSQEGNAISPPSG